MIFWWDNHLISNIHHFGNIFIFYKLIFFETRGIVYFCKRLLIIFISIIDFNSIFKGTLIVGIFLIFRFILNKSFHYVTDRLQIIESLKLNILTFSILFKIAENSLEDEQNIFIFFQILQVVATNILKFGFLIFLIQNTYFLSLEAAHFSLK